MVKYFFATIQVFGPAGLLGLVLAAAGFWELSGIHMTIVH